MAMLPRSLPLALLTSEDPKSPSRSLRYVHVPLPSSFFGCIGTGAGIAICLFLLSGFRETLRRPQNPIPNQ